MEYEQVAKSRWDWFQESVVLIREWSSWKDYNEQPLKSIPIKVIFSDMEVGLWSQRALSAITSTLGKPVGA